MKLFWPLLAFVFFCSYPLPVYPDSLPQIILHLAPGQEINSETPISIYLELPNSLTAQVQTAQIKIRGSSSRDFAKKSYNLEIEMNDSFSDLGLPLEDDWVLSGPYMDKSLVRDAFAYTLGNHIREGWAPQFRFVDLWINTQGQGQKNLGIYLLIQKINNKNFGIQRQSEGEELNGFLANIEMGSKPDLAHLSHSGMKIEIKYPKDFQQSQHMTDELNQIFQSIDGAMKSELPVVDMMSFVDFFIIQEFLGNSDGFRRSQYIHRKAAHTPIIMGPLWDFNTTTGAIKGLFDSYRTDIWFHQLKYPFDFISILPWWKQLIKQDFFKQLVAKRYWQLRQNVLSQQNLEQILNLLVDQLPESNIVREQEIWQTFGRDLFSKKRWNQVLFDDAHKTPACHRDEIERIRFWLRARGQWLDKNIESF